MALKDVIQDPARREAIAADALVEVEAELDERGGLTGVAMRQGFKAVQKIRPNLFESNIDKMLPNFAAAIDPHYAAGLAAGNVESHFVANADEIAEAMLTVTDTRVKQSTNKVATGVYDRLRGKAKSSVSGAMPRVARFVVKHGN